MMRFFEGNVLVPSILLLELIYFNGSFERIMSMYDEKCYLKPIHGSLPVRKIVKNSNDLLMSESN